MKSTIIDSSELRVGSIINYNSHGVVIGPLVVTDIYESYVDCKQGAEEWSYLIPKKDICSIDNTKS